MLSKGARQWTNFATNPVCPIAGCYHSTATAHGMRQHLVRVHAYLSLRDVALAMDQVYRQVGGVSWRDYVREVPA